MITEIKGSDLPQEAINYAGINRNKKRNYNHAVERAT